MDTLAQDLFVQARELPAAERDAFLNRACGGDAELRLEVQRLLIDAARADSFFGDENGATLSPEEFAEIYAEKEGDRVGPYKLLQRIGEGGFGVVWMAEQSVPISRKVALKVIKAGMDTKQVLARFEAERQALALMDHPHIARVLDAGATPAGRPWFAMELVKGIPITDYCDQAGLGIKERLALFRDVCSAINHAHQKGIIHRDIKPSNVMVTLYADKPVVKVIDFGIAKATQGKLTDKTLFTRFEQFIGTPVYMSPEQANLSSVDIDTRSDIYALGILLYEMLVGKPPFDPKTLVSAGYDEMRRIIREVEPAKPSSRLATAARVERTQLAKARQVDESKLGKLIEPDLDWIVMKAIEKDRTRRYETANGLAADIERFLANEAVTASPPSASYQFGKFVRRHKAALRVAVVIAVVLVAATIVSTWQAVRATQAGRETAATLEKVAAERDAKELARKEAEAARRDAEALSTFLSQVFQSPDPARDGRTITVAETLDSAVAKLETDLQDQPEQRVKLQEVLGSTYSALGLPWRALPLQEQLRDYHMTVLGPKHPTTLSAQGKLAELYFQLGRKNDAILLQEKVLNLSRQILGSENEKTIQRIDQLAEYYRENGRKQDAVPLREEALELSRKVFGSEHRSTLYAMGSLASSHVGTPGFEEPLALREEVLALSLKAYGPDHSITQYAVNNLALSYSRVGRLDESIRMQEELVDQTRRIYGPKDPRMRKLLSNLRRFYGEAGRGEDVVRIQEELADLMTANYGPSHPSTLAAMGYLSKLHHNLTRAIEVNENLLEQVSSAHGSEHPSTLDAMLNSAKLYSDAGLQDKAMSLREEGLGLSRRVRGANHVETREAMFHLAASYFDAARPRDAVSLLLEVLEGDPGDTTTLLRVVAIQLWFGKDGAYEETFRRVWEWARVCEDPDHLGRMAKVMCLMSLRNPEIEQRVTEWARTGLGRGQEQAVKPWRHLTLGMALFRGGLYADALVELQKAEDLAQTVAEASRNRIIPTAAFYRAMCLFQRGEVGEARSAFAAAEASMKPPPTGIDEAVSAHHDDLILWLAFKEAREMLSDSAHPIEPATATADEEGSGQ
jgi:eukaryotic-like serine/threonine-protein kinase